MPSLDSFVSVRLSPKKYLLYSKAAITGSKSLQGRCENSERDSIFLSWEKYSFSMSHITSSCTETSYRSHNKGYIRLNPSQEGLGGVDRRAALSDSDLCICREFDVRVGHMFVTDRIYLNYVDTAKPVTIPYVRLNRS